MPNYDVPWTSPGLPSLRRGAGLPPLPFPPSPYPQPSITTDIRPPSLAPTASISTDVRQPVWATTPGVTSPLSPTPSITADRRGPRHSGALTIGALSRPPLLPPAPTARMATADDPFRRSRLPLSRLARRY